MEFHSSAPYFPSSIWTLEENKLFEKALALYDKETPDRWHMIAKIIPGKTISDLMGHYKQLVDDISRIEAGWIELPSYNSSGFRLDWFSGDSQSVDGLKNGSRRASAKPPDHERKKGVPWSEDEHRLFLLGLKKHGKGDWRNISRNFVQSRTATQVASHAQKYFIRLSSGSKDKRRSSIHDITTANLSEKRSPSPPSPNIQSQAFNTQLSTSSDPIKTQNFNSFFSPNQTSEEVGSFISSVPQAKATMYISPPRTISPYEEKLHESDMGTQHLMYRLQAYNLHNYC
ncbi:hypothetical protein AMTR_s00029p00215750 [Amborella trichopoda]|uniref:Uncharacterized protein n=3 Tax=Amborella trichopoda TaxID=13333 RepID=W1PIA2_AMBTC|nr:hypothetical protein AMTR_s00029p00215750 [Amborella trichopoda]